MWLDNLKELKKEKGYSDKKIAEKANLSEKTVSRIFSGDTDSPYVDTLHRIVKALGGSLDDILADTKAVVGTTHMATLNETLDSTAAERDLLGAERDLFVAENAVLKEEVAALTAKVKMLEMQLKYKDEIIAVHNYYIKKENKG